MNPDISIIIANYNTKYILKKCLENLKTIKKPKLQVIVVDNGSTDGSYKMVSKNFKWVEAIKGKNKGIAHAYNLGLKQASGNYYLFLGTDAFPNQKTLKGVLEYMEKHPKVGICTAKLVLRDGSLDIDAHRGFPTPWASLTHFTKLNKLFPKSKLFNQYFLGYKDMSKPHEIDLCISHFMFVRKEALKSVNGWDEDFFVYGEDVDFCYRVKQAGWKIMYLPQFTVKHLKGVSVGTRKESKDITKADSKTKKKMKKMTTQAMKMFYKKHYVKKYPWTVNKIVLGGITLLEKIRNW